MTRTTTDRRQANCRVKKERKESSGAVNKSSESEHKMLFSDCVTAANLPKHKNNPVGRSLHARFCVN